MANRVSKDNYYLDIAQTVSERSTCLRRRFGAIIVKNDSIISTGYNGAPRGRKNCDDLGYCFREKLGIPRDRFPMNISKYGNVSSASIPLLLTEMKQDGRLKPGMKLVLASFGAGLTWDANYIVY